MVNFLKWWWKEYDVKGWITFALFTFVTIGIPGIILSGLFALEDKYFGTEILLITTCFLFVAFFTYGFISIGVDELRKVKSEYRQSLNNE